MLEKTKAAMTDIKRQVARNTTRKKEEQEKEIKKTIERENIPRSNTRKEEERRGGRRQICGCGGRVRENRKSERDSVKG